MRPRPRFTNGEYKATAVAPEGGERGGRVLATSTPEEVAEPKTSCKAQYLRQGVGKRKRKS